MDQKPLNLLPVSAVSELLKVSPQTLAIWRCQKKGPDYVKLGRSVYYRPQDIEAWIERSAVRVSAAAAD